MSGGFRAALAVNRLEVVAGEARREFASRATAGPTRF
jgi:hypothetical protein